MGLHQAQRVSTSSAQAQPSLVKSCSECGVSKSLNTACTRKTIRITGMLTACHAAVAACHPREQPVAAGRCCHLIPRPSVSARTHVASDTQCALVRMRPGATTNPVPVDSRLGWFWMCDGV